MSLPLEGIVVIDLARMLPGPYASMILADLGAEVIRVEDPKYPYGSPPPFYQKGRYRESAFNSIIMRNKKSITLDLKKEQALEIFYKLIEKADVILETFRPKVTEKLKVDYNTLFKINKSIIYCSLTGYGQYGPYEQMAGHDLNYIGICGILDLNKEREIEGQENRERKPVLPGVQAADIGGGLVSTIGILGALIEREKNLNKEGQYLDISMTDCVFSFMPMAAAFQFSKDKYDGITKPRNPLHGEVPFYSVYKTKDNKYLSVGAIEIKFWRGVCEGIGRKDLITKGNALGIEKEEVFQEVQNEFLKKTQDEWMNIFRNIDACVMPVKNFDEACEDSQIKARNMITELEHPKFGKIQNVNSPIKYSRTPLTIRSVAPKIGQHTIEILKELNYTDENIKNFKKSGLF
ncbi:MAG: CaiB/BaiF CoA transferase family protein [Candidatus Hermodarchaeota archaeon]